MNDNRFLEAARLGLNDFWRYAATFFLAVSLLVMSSVCAVLVLILATRGRGIDLTTGTFDLSQLPASGFLLANLVPFTFIVVGLWIGVRLLHKRPFLSLINPDLKFDWRRFGFSAAVWVVLSVLSDLVLSLLQPGNYAFNLDLPALLPVVAISLVFLPLQVAGEELFFRGYLAQGIGHRFGFWAAWIIPSLFFGLLHGANPEVGAYGMLLTMPLYIGMGLLFGWITLRSESLELALGAHLANNLYASLLVTFPSSALTTPALFTIQEYNPVLTMVAFFIVVPIYLGVLHVGGREFFRKGLFSVS